MKVGDLVKVFGEGVGIVANEEHLWQPEETYYIVEVLFPHGIVKIVSDDCEVINESR